MRISGIHRNTQIIVVTMEMCLVREIVKTDNASQKNKFGSSHSPHRRIEKTEEERASVRERNRLSAMIFGIADMNFLFDDMNSYTPDAVYVHLYHP